jgi:hypothetical protein
MFYKAFINIYLIVTNINYFFEKCLIPAAFGNLLIWVLAAFGKNCLKTALGAFRIFIKNNNAIIRKQFHGFSFKTFF